MNVTDIKLKVLDAKRRDVASGIARINQKTMEKLKVTSGDVIEIQGKSKTSAIASKAYEEDEERDIIRLDEIIRRNADISVKQAVTIRRAEVADAKSIILAPTDVKLRPDTEFINFLKNRVRDRTFVEEDILTVMMMGHPVNFVVLDTEPDGIVRMTLGTHVQVEKEPPTIKREVSVMTRLSHRDLKQIDKLIGIGLFDSRSEAVAFLTHEGIVAKRETLEQLTEKLTEIRRIRDEAKEMLSSSTSSIPLLNPKACPKCGSENSEEAKFCSHCGEKMVVGERND